MDNDNETPRDDRSGPRSRDPEDGGLVERLLNAAGPGPEIPVKGAERVKSAIREAWRDEVAVAARQRRRLWAGGLAAAAAVIIAVGVIPKMQRGLVETGPLGMSVAVIEGTLEVTPPGSKVSFLGPDDAGSTIPDGSLVRTREGDRAALQLTGGQSLRIDDGTMIRLDSERSVSLDAGAVYLSSANGAGCGIEVRTALGTATEIGTQFEVRLESSALIVKVREGFVSLTRGEDEYRIDHGIALSVEADGSVTTAPITPYDPAWEWTQEISPAFEIDGKSAMAYLAWVSSETGLSVSYADPEVERLAATTLVHGSLAGLAPSETPAAVLPTCGLSAVAEPGALVIVRLGAEHDDI